MSRIREIILIDENGEAIDVQNPLPADSDSVYAKDIWVEESDITGWTGEVTDPFDNLHSELRNDSTDNPKEMLIHFQRTVYATAIGFGSSAGGEFSNLEIEFIGSGGVVRYTFDESADATKRTSYLAQIPLEGNAATLAFNAIRLKFHTADPISITNITIRKEIQTASIIRAAKPDGNVAAIGATRNNNLRVSVQEYGDTPAIDAFARLRVSNPFTIFDSKQLHDDQPLFWDESLGGSATSTHSVANAQTAIAVTASASDFAIRQTKQQFNYQPGKSQLILLTFLASQQAGTTKRIGLFNGTGANYLTPFNGVFFSVSGSAISWNIAKNGSTAETVTQANWNVDPLDGTGPSGITLDLDAAQIAIIDYEWLGVGRVRVGFVIDGLVYYVHYFNHANDSSFTSVYMSTPNLPVRYDIVSDGSGAGSLQHICSSVASEGGVEDTGVLRGIDTGVSYISINSAGTNYALLGMRLKTTHLDVTVRPVAASAIIGTNDDFRWQLQLNPTLAAALTFGDVANSAIQSAVGDNTNIVSADGVILGSGYGKANGNITAQLNTALRIGSSIAGTLDELYLCITPISSNATALCSLDFRELL